MGFCFYEGNQAEFVRRKEMKKLMVLLAMVSLVCDKWLLQTELVSGKHNLC
jgi:hypothetical protein